MRHTGTHAPATHAADCQHATGQHKETQSHKVGLWLRIRMDWRMPIPNIRLIRLEPP